MCDEDINADFFPSAAASVRSSALKILKLKLNTHIASLTTCVPAPRDMFCVSSCDELCAQIAFVSYTACVSCCGGWNVTL